MAGVPGLVAKDGAEGVFAAALPDGSRGRGEGRRRRGARGGAGARRRPAGTGRDGRRCSSGSRRRRCSAAGVPVGELRPAAPLLVLGAGVLDSDVVARTPDPVR